LLVLRDQVGLFCRWVGSFWFLVLQPPKCPPFDTDPQLSVISPFRTC
jgi:hypothetical protein